MDATDSCSAESSGKGDNLPPGKGLRQKDLEKIHQNGPGIFDQVYTCIYKYHILSYYVKIYVYTSIYLLKLYSCIKHISIKKTNKHTIVPNVLPKRCDVSHRPEVSRFKFLLTFAWYVPLVRIVSIRFPHPSGALPASEIWDTSNAESMVH